MSTVHLLWERSDGDTIKGLSECDTASADQKQMVDSDLKYGRLEAGQVSSPQIVTIRTFSWVRNGDPLNPITSLSVYVDEYYSADPVYTADATKSFCDSASTASFGDYGDAGGSNSPSFDLGKLLEWGDAATGGLEVSLDRGKTYTQIKTGTGDSVANAIEVPATAFDVGVTDGQLEPGDRAILYTRVSLPVTYTDAANAGVYLFTLGAYYDFTE